MKALRAKREERNSMAVISRRKSSIPLIISSVSSVDGISIRMDTFKWHFIGSFGAVFCIAVAKCYLLLHFLVNGLRESGVPMKEGHCYRRVFLFIFPNRSVTKPTKYALHTHTFGIGFREMLHRWTEIVTSIVSKLRYAWMEVHAILRFHVLYVTE